VPPDAELRNGAMLIPRAGMTEGDPLPLVKHYEGLRVTDVVDACKLSIAGYHLDGLFHPPLCARRRKMTHRIYGVAVTAQYVPTNKPPAREMPIEQFRKWHSEWYRDTAPELFSRLFAGNGGCDRRTRRGQRRFSSARTTLWDGSRRAWRASSPTAGAATPTRSCSRRSRSIRSTSRTARARTHRNGYDQQPVSVGGAPGASGDMVVADGDGVVVVPREHAGALPRSPGRWRRRQGRPQAAYEKMKMPLDPTVK